MGMTTGERWTNWMEWELEWELERELEWELKWELEYSPSVLLQGELVWVLVLV